MKLAEDQQQHDACVAEYKRVSVCSFRVHGVLSKSNMFGAFNTGSVFFYLPILVDFYFFRYKS